MLTIDGKNIVGPWVIEVRESESGYKFGVKGKKNIDFSNHRLLTIDAWSLVKRRSTKIPGNLAGEKFLIFDLTILKSRSHIVITKSKILAWSDRSSLSYEVRHAKTLCKTVIFWYFLVFSV